MSKKRLFCPYIPSLLTVWEPVESRRATLASASNHVGFAIALSAESFALVHVVAALVVAVALEGPVVEVRGDRDDRVLAESFLHGVWDEEAVLSTLLDKLPAPINGVIRL